MSDVTLPVGIPVWPDTLPLPRIEGYGLAPQSNAVRTDIDAGAARMRLRSTSTLYRVCFLFRGLSAANRGAEVLANICDRESKATS